MQKFTHTQQYTQSPDEVLARYTSADFLIHKYQQMGREEVTLEEEYREGDVVRLRIRYYNINDMDLPDFVRKFMSERTLVIQTTEWQLSKRAGRLTVDPQHSPAHMAADMTLEDDGQGGCTNRIDWQVSCSIPLLGGKIEKVIVDGLRSKADEDQATTQALLDEQA